MSNKFHRYEAWKESHKLNLAIYQSTHLFPDIERFGLISQIRRSATSVCANIAEGCERRTTKDFVSFIYISKASLSETRYHLLLAKDLGYLPVEKHEELDKQAYKVAALLYGLIVALEKRAK